MALPATLPVTPPRLKGRFQLRGLLGTGGNGLVYRALDLQTGGHVAVKLLRAAGVDGLYAIKREFRALADLRHPNLVTFHELFADGSPAFLTMELVEGISLLEHVRAGVSGPLGPDGIDRLTRVLHQLAGALVALHAAGRVHRDVKPENVVVAADGRTVLLDAGLVTRAEATEGPSFGPGAGTLRYMPPEQAGGGPLHPSSDVFSVACVVAEALTGLPCTPARETVARGEEDALVARWCRTGAPEALARVTAAALRPDPRARPTLAELCAALPPVEVGEPYPIGAPPEPPFVGRVAELGALEHALSSWDNLGPRVVEVRGPSGVGKTRLVRAWTSRCKRGVSRVVEGRCDPAETVPFQALDRLLDRVAADLHRGVFEAPELPEEEAHAVRAVFPVLGHALVGDVVDAPPSSTGARARALAALRVLLRSYARANRTVLVVDDAQWMDPDSEALFAEILRPPEPPPLFVLLLARDDSPSRLDPVCRIAVGPLPRADAADLARRLGASAADELADEAGGLPFLVAALVRWGAVDGLVDGCVALGGPVALDVLRLVAWTGAPLPRIGLVQSVPGAMVGLRALRAAGLVREVPIEAGIGLAPSHDRVAEVVQRAIPDTARADLHRRVARCLELADDPRAELVTLHLAAAGEREEAVRVALVGADRAREAGAWEQALRLLTRIVELDPDGRGRAARRRLAETLAALGRTREAAATFHAAMRDAHGPERTALGSRAVEQRYRAGEVAAGRAALRTLMAELGVYVPAGRSGFFLGVLSTRARLLLRGLDWRASAPSEAAAERLDALWTATTVTAFYDAVEAEYWSLAHLSAALDGGPPGAVARALSWEATMRARFRGTFLARGVERLLAAAERLARDGGSPYDLGLVHVNAVFVRFLDGDVGGCLAAADAAARAFARLEGSTRWEEIHVEVFAVGMRWYQGDIRRVRELCHQLALGVADDDRAGLLDTGHFWSATRVALLEGRVGDARRVLGDCRARWARIGAPLGAWSRVLAAAEIELADERPDVAWETLERGRAQLRASGALLLPWAKGTWLFQRAGTALALLQRGDRRKRALRAAVRDATRWLCRGTWSVGPPAAALLRAGLAQVDGEPVRVRSELEAAVEGARAADAGLLGWSARHALSSLGVQPPPAPLDCEVESERLLLQVLPVRFVP